MKWMTVNYIIPTRDVVICDSIFSSFYLGHLPDIIRQQKESGNDEISLAIVAQQW